MSQNVRLKAGARGRRLCDKTRIERHQGGERAYLLRALLNGEVLNRLQKSLNWKQVVGLIRAATQLWPDARKRWSPTVEIACEFAHRVFVDDRQLLGVRKGKLEWGQLVGQ